MPASLGLHLIVVALLVFGLPHVVREPETEQAVSVDLVPPPEPEAKPPPEAEKPPEKTPTPLKTGEKQPPPQPPVSRLNPVFRFGAKDAGPREAPDGNGAQDEAKPAPRETPDDRASAARDVPPAPDGETVLSLPGTAQTPTPVPAAPPAARKAPALEEARTLFSRSATGDALATEAMGDLPRDVRGGTLCVTELRAQLLNAAPPYFADLLPSYRLKQGTVIEAPSAPFRAGGQWRDLSFRCEVDADATRVVSFAMRIGAPIPRGEWKRRGLPSQ